MKSGLGNSSQVWARQSWKNKGGVIINSRHLDNQIGPLVDGVVQNPIANEKTSVDGLSRIGVRQAILGTNIASTSKAGRSPIIVVRECYVQQEALVPHEAFGGVVLNSKSMDDQIGSLLDGDDRSPIPIDFDNRVVGLSQNGHSSASTSSVDRSPIVDGRDSYVQQEVVVPHEALVRSGSSMQNGSVEFLSNKEVPHEALLCQGSQQETEKSSFTLNKDIDCIPELVSCCEDEQTNGCADLSVALSVGQFYEVPIMEVVDLLMMELISRNGGIVKKRRGRPRKKVSMKNQVSHSDLPLSTEFFDIDQHPKLVADKVWEIGRNLGVSCCNNEGDIINRLCELKQRDKSAIGRVAD
ncbi:hypothetical protein SESBI_33627 [Sesbania bispinosa]|nr:hypothetical protein SESBI_33627 [Sesbania bispinosa]